MLSFSKFLKDRRFKIKEVKRERKGTEGRESRSIQTCPLLCVKLYLFLSIFKISIWTLNFYFHSSFHPPRQFKVSWFSKRSISFLVESLKSWLDSIVCFSPQFSMPSPLLLDWYESVLLLLPLKEACTIHFAFHPRNRLGESPYLPPVLPSVDKKEIITLWILFLKNLFIYLSIYLFIYLFLAALGLCCCAWAFSSCGKQGLLSSCNERGLLFVVVRGLLIVGLLLLRSTGSMCVGFSSCDSRALECRLSSCGAWT